MSRFAAIGAACLASALVVSAWAQPQIPPRPSARQRVEQLRADLREAQSVVKGLADRRARDRLELLLTRAELHASELQNAAAQLDRPPVFVAVPRVVTDAEFAPMLKAVKDQSFDNRKLEVVQSFGKTRRFTSAQVKQLTQAFTFENDRVKAAVWLHPLLADPENFFMVLEAFTFDSSKNAVRQQIKQK
ncbi:MAG: DUF4476 domain-containing protein [Isosphaeraceae bacterium]